ncbi:uncharacterized protein LOC125675467 [Ostrea edulis]|uniref:uncharacterized protein LOC125675467 n=1 Tax=Ostrea edulis TaxID=37623 RepID=UPI0024AE8917|nr:uncharacterized protein LOC125675467 [Ostrea edulis]XP_048769083.2 uncharacterized protein LOC125675467 [Ostrea edulis]
MSPLATYLVLICVLLKIGFYASLPQDKRFLMQNGMHLKRTDLCNECTKCKCFPHATLDFSCAVVENYGYGFCEQYICNITCPTATTTVSQPHPVTCNKTSAITAVALNQPVKNSSVSSCLDIYYQPPEALVTLNCGIPSVQSWKQGQKVVEACRSNFNTTLPYTPVSTFTHSHHDVISGILVHCTSEGFTMIAQTCTSSPGVMNITHNSKYHAQDFHFILS